jgi:UDP-N-acetylglucosamine pyrophosphorylase
MYKIAPFRVEQGIEYLHFLGCENLLSQPLDPNMLALLDETGADLVCKVGD